MLSKLLNTFEDENVEYFIFKLTQFSENILVKQIRFLKFRF